MGGAGGCGLQSVVGLLGQMPVVAVTQDAQDAGQVPPLRIRQGSHVLLPSGNWPSPHPEGQSTSVASMQPGAQQPSAVVPEQVVIGVCTQWAAQPVPAMESTVHGLLSLQSAVTLVGHLPAPLVMPVSHSSPPDGSTTPLPQTAEQSISVFALLPGGQQPSRVVVLAAGNVAAHCAWQLVPTRATLGQLTFMVMAAHSLVLGQ